MRNLKYLGVPIVVLLILGITIHNLIIYVKDKKEPLNNYYAFVYPDNAKVKWFELKSRNGKIQGEYHEKSIGKDNGKKQPLKEKIYPVVGKVTRNGYEFNVKQNENYNRYSAKFVGPHLSIRKKTDKENKLYNSVNQKELNNYIEALKDYYKEENEQKQIREFFSKLRNVYGYLHSDINDKMKLFIKIDEALLEGELTGSLTIIDKEGKETKYNFNGITDGNKLRFYTKVNNKETKLEGKFYNGVERFDLTYWETNKKMMFRSITEKEFTQLK